jgi:hypothetical protein
LKKIDEETLLKCSKDDQVNTGFILLLRWMEIFIAINPDMKKEIFCYLDLDAGDVRETWTHSQNQSKFSMD